MNLPLSPAVAMRVVYGLNLLLMVTSISLVALVVARCALKRDASARYLLCLTALVCILLAPLVVLAAGKARFGLVMALELSRAPLPQVLPATDLPLLSRPEARSPLSAAGSPELGLYLLLLVWALGATWGVVRLAWGWRTSVRLRQMAKPLDTAELGSALEQIQQTLGSSAPPVCASGRVAAPIAVGLIRPAVILPEGLVEVLTQAQLRHVLLHECAHVVYRHAFGGVVQRLAGLLYWPHPLVAALCREMSRAREEVADNVASQEDGAACYARTLLLIAQGLSTAPQYASALALLGPESSLERRIAGLLDPRRNRMVGVKRWKLWGVTGGLALTMALAGAVRVVADDTQAQQETKQQSPVSAQVKSVQPQLHVQVAQHPEAHARQYTYQVRVQSVPHVKSRVKQISYRVIVAKQNTVRVIKARPAHSSTFTVTAKIRSATSGRAEVKVYSFVRGHRQDNGQKLEGVIGRHEGATMTVPTAVTTTVATRIKPVKLVTTIQSKTIRSVGVVVQSKGATTVTPATVAKVAISANPAVPAKLKNSHGSSTITSTRVSSNGTISIGSTSVGDSSTGTISTGSGTSTGSSTTGASSGSSSTGGSSTDGSGTSTGTTDTSGGTGSSSGGG